MIHSRQCVLWWGRFDADYSRNRILRLAYATLGWQVRDFHPWFSPLGDIEARLRRAPRADLIHVPCFRQRDIGAARRYARHHGLPLLIDPLISAYDKQVFEREKFAAHSPQGKHLLREERQLFQGADSVLADTAAHARFFVDTLGVAEDKVHVVYVGAEETLFHPAAAPPAPNHPIEVLFYGSFIPLQGPLVIIDAARRYQGPPVNWVLLGDGPLLEACKKNAQGLPNVRFESRLAYADLPDRIRRADILLGVFGTTAKTQRVIPNKVFQALACAKPVVTAQVSTYPAMAGNGETGIVFVAPGKPEELAQAIGQLALDTTRLEQHGQVARAYYQRHFSTRHIEQQLADALAQQPPGRNG